MQALAQAVAHRDALKQGLLALRKRLEEERARLSRAEALGAAERWVLANYVAALGQDSTELERALKEAEEHVDLRRSELVQKAKERGLLDSLKEKQSARHLHLERQQEQRNHDETATLRYRPAAF